MFDSTKKELTIAAFVFSTLALVCIAFMSKKMDQFRVELNETRQTGLDTLRLMDERDTAYEIRFRKIEDNSRAMLIDLVNRIQQQKCRCGQPFAENPMPNSWAKSWDEPITFPRSHWPKDYRKAKSLDYNWATGENWE